MKPLKDLKKGETGKIVAMVSYRDTLPYECIRYSHRSTYRSVTKRLVAANSY